MQNKGKKSSTSKSLKNGPRTMSRQEAGRKGAEARWGRSEPSNGSSRHPSSYSNHQGRSNSGWGSDYNEGQTHQRSSYQHEPNASRRGQSSQSGHMSRQEAGRLGAEARWGQNQGHRQGQDFGSYGQRGCSQCQCNRQSGNMGRQQMHQRGNQGWGQSQENGGYYEKNQGYSQGYGQGRGQRNSSMNQDFQHSRRRQGMFGGMSPQEAGRRGAEERWGNQYETDRDDENYGYGSRGHEGNWGMDYDEEGNYGRQYAQGRDSYEESEDDDYEPYENTHDNEEEDEDEEYETPNRRRQSQRRNY